MLRLCSFEPLGVLAFALLSAYAKSRSSLVRVNDNFRERFDGANLRVDLNRLMQSTDEAIVGKVSLLKRF